MRRDSAVKLIDDLAGESPASGSSVIRRVPLFGHANARPFRILQLAGEIQNEIAVVLGEVTHTAI